MPLFHPYVTIILSNTSLWVQERKTNTALGTETGIVTAAVLYGFFVELVPKTAEERKKTEHP